MMKGGRPALVWISNAGVFNSPWAVVISPVLASPSSARSLKEQVDDPMPRGRRHVKGGPHLLFPPDLTTAHFNERPDKIDDVCRTLDRLPMSVEKPSEK